MGMVGLIFNLLSFYGCYKEHLHYTPCSAEEGIASNITLEVYNYYYMGDRHTIIVEDHANLPLQPITVFNLDREDYITIQVDPELVDETYGSSSSLIVYAHAPGFFSKIYIVNNGDEIYVDLDAIPHEVNTIAGVLIPIDYAHDYSNNDTIKFGLQYEGHGTVNLTTDTQGRFCLTDLSPGRYTIIIDGAAVQYREDINLTAGNIKYFDFFYLLLFIL